MDLVASSLVLRRRFSQELEGRSRFGGIVRGGPAKPDRPPPARVPWLFCWSRVKPGMGSPWCRAGLGGAEVWGAKR